MSAASPIGERTACAGQLPPGRTEPPEVYFSFLFLFGVLARVPHATRRLGYVLRKLPILLSLRGEAWAPSRHAFARLPLELIFNENSAPAGRAGLEAASRPCEPVALIGGIEMGFALISVDSPGGDIGAELPPRRVDCLPCGAFSRSSMPRTAALQASTSGPRGP